MFLMEVGLDSEAVEDEFLHFLAKLFTSGHCRQRIVDSPGLQFSSLRMDEDENVGRGVGLGLEGRLRKVGAAKTLGLGRTLAPTWSSTGKAQ